MDKVYTCGVCGINYMDVHARNDHEVREHGDPFKIKVVIPEIANPKHNQGTAKLPLHLWPQTATAMGCIGMLEGAEKYGRNNFRATDVVASIYVAACMRHLSAWFNGEEFETMTHPETGEEVKVKPHMAGALSCLAILVDAEANNSLIDDRNYTNDKEVNYHSLVQYLTPFVGRIQELFKDRNPKHWTIQDDKHDL